MSLLPPLATAVCALAIVACGGSSPNQAQRAARSTATAPAATTTQTSPRPRPTPHPLPPAPRAPFAVGLRTVTLVDSSRMIHLPSGALEPRRLVTLIRYPAQGPRSGVDLADAPPLHGAGRFPLIVFGHGFAVTPQPYAPLLRAWARAGYVVAAPIFPLANADAPGAPNESDLVNQPRDVSFVITRMLSASAELAGFLSQLLQPRQIAVAGQSDGGDTALAVAYDTEYLDRRVRAAAILSGAEIPGVRGFDFPAPSPPLLATQGTADTVNPPSFTQAFFDIAPAPKYLLAMFGAQHLEPYTNGQPQLRIVERVTVDFFDHYLKDEPRALRRMVAAGDVSGISVVQADP